MSPLENGLIAFWDFNDNITDLVSGLTFTPSNGENYNTGLIGNAWDSIDPLASYLSLGSDVVDPKGGSLTVSVTFKVSLKCNANLIVSDDVGQNNIVKIVLYSSGSMLGSVYGNSLLTNTSLFPYSATSWNVVIFRLIRSAPAISAIQLTINGSDKTGASRFDSLPTGMTQLKIDSTNLYNGLIDSIGVWNRALGSSERQALWNGGAGWEYVPPVALEGADGTSEIRNNNTIINLPSQSGVENIGWKRVTSIQETLDNTGIDSKLAPRLRSARGYTGDSLYG